MRFADISLIAVVVLTVAVLLFSIPHWRRLNNGVPPWKVIRQLRKEQAPYSFLLMLSVVGLWLTVVTAALSNFFGR